MPILFTYFLRLFIFNLCQKRRKISLFDLFVFASHNEVRDLSILGGCVCVSKSAQDNCDFIKLHFFSSTISALGRFNMHKLIHREQFLPFSYTSFTEGTISFQIFAHDFRLSFGEIRKSCRRSIFRIDRFLLFSLIIWLFLLRLVKILFVPH